MKLIETNLYPEGGRFELTAIIGKEGPGMLVPNSETVVLDEAKVSVLGDGSIGISVKAERRPLAPPPNEPKARKTKAKP